MGVKKINKILELSKVHTLFSVCLLDVVKTSDRLFGDESNFFF